MSAKKMASDVLSTLQVGEKSYRYFSIPALAQQGYPGVMRLPVSLKILLENLLRHPRRNGGDDDIRELVKWLSERKSQHEIAFMPARVLMQDFTGVPAVVDLAAMRDALAARGENPALVNPLNPVDLVIDHSVMVDKSASASAFKENVRIEMARNQERYEFLRWGQQAFDNFRLVPPGTGICHQVNLEFLARTVWCKETGGELYAFPDTLVGTDSHTTMINALAVLGWGVGGIEAEAAMLGQPLSMLIPEVVGVNLKGRLRAGVTATDLVLTVAEALRKHGVVGKFVEFYGNGLEYLSLADRATISNMSPEYGATCSFFAVDDETLKYLRLTGRDEDTLALVEAYTKAQGMWGGADDSVAFSSIVELELDAVVPSLAGPKRPQDRVPLTALAGVMQGLSRHNEAVPVAGQDFSLSNGDIVIAAITSCTNTSNPAVMMAAGLLAKKAVELGLQRKPWVKTSLAPGSKVVTNYLLKADLQRYLDELGFNLVGYGCTTCIGNSGPLPAEIDAAIEQANLTVCSVLSGNRNFEGRIHPSVRANWLGSPPLVVAFALAGTININMATDQLGTGKDGQPVYLKDVWPDTAAVNSAMAMISRDMFTEEYADVFTGDEQWNSLPINPDKTYQWNNKSTYIQNPPFLSPLLGYLAGDIENARVLALLGDSVTTDHISPAGSIALNSPAGRYLLAHGVAPDEFNSYGSRRGNHEVMMRGTFANPRIKNEMLQGVEGGYTQLLPAGEQISIYEAAMNYQARGVPLVLIAGREYGTGSSRDWAAKGTRLLGVRAVIAESFERIHRSNLAGMGVLPLQFTDGVNRKTLELNGTELIALVGLETITAGMMVTLQIIRNNGEQHSCRLLSRLDTDEEVAYFRNGGIMPYVLEKLLEGAASND